MSKVQIKGNASGTGIFTIAAPNTNTDYSISLPTTSAELVTTSSPTIASPTFTGDVTFDTDTLVVDSTNNRVGIGTDSPSSKLHVYSNTTSAPAMTIRNDNASAGGRGLLIQHDNGGEATDRYALSVVTSYGSGDVPAFFVGGGARVGIGTNSPAETLDVRTDSDPTDGVLVLLRNNTQGGNGAFLKFDVNSVGDWSIGMRDNTNAFSIFKDNGNSGTNMLTIASNGNVLIGSSQVTGTGNTSAPGTIFAQTGKTYHIATSDIPLVLDRKTTDGRILEFRRDQTVIGSIDVTSSSTQYATTSDRRLKDNINTITDGKEKILAMNPVTHTWKANPDDPAVHGFIAQEMQDIIPEAVAGDPNSDEMMSMDYGRITPVIVAALQDALKEINDNKLEIKELKEIISKLENR